MSKDLKAETKQNVTFFGITLAVMIIMLAYYLPKAYGIFFPQDEFGYWNNAVGIIGINWDEIAAGQSRYAYGYSILLVPLLTVFKSNPMTLYRAAIILNALLFILYVFLFRKIVCKIFKRLTGIQITMITLISSFAPYVIGYVHYTIAETLINVLFIYLLCIVCELEEKRFEWKAVIKAALLCILMLCVHYRTIGVGISLVFILLLYYWKDSESPKKKSIMLAGFVCLLIITAHVVTRLGYFSFYKLFSIKNILNLLFGMIGKIYYALVATLGLGCVGLRAMLKKKDEPFCCFFLIAFTLMCGISSLFFIDGIRYDQLVYGRYIEMFLPLLMCFGMSEMLEGQIGRTLLIRLIVVIGAFCALITLYALRSGFTEYVSNFASGMSWMFANRGESIAWLYITPFFVSVISLVLFDLSKSNDTMSKMILPICFFVSIVSSKLVLDNSVYVYQNNDRSDYELSVQVKELLPEKGEIIFLDSPYNNYVNLMQFWLMDKQLHLVQGLDDEAFVTPENAIVIIHKNYEIPEQLEDRYNEKNTSAHFMMFYNR